MKRLVRFALLAGLVAGAVAALRALRREQEPLPAPPTGPGGGPWPPLQNPSPSPPKPADDRAVFPTAERTTPATPTAPAPAPSAPAEPAAPAPAPADEDTPSGPVVPEPGGIPVGGTGPDRTPWLEPTADGECPDGYPIKGNLKSKIFHSPGQLNYDRTTPDRCYRSAEAAEADGLRAAKR